MPTEYFIQLENNFSKILLFGIALHYSRPVIDRSDSYQHFSSAMLFGTEYNTILFSILELLIILSDTFIVPTYNFAFYVHII